MAEADGVDISFVLSGFLITFVIGKKIAIGHADAAILIHQGMSMARILTIGVDQERAGTATVRSARLQGWGIERRTAGERLSLEFPNRDLPELTTLDSFVLLALFYAMENADVIRVKGALSTSFVRNVRAFQEAWQCMRPDMYRVVAIEPDAIVSEGGLHAGRQRAAISAFSGGLDATFLALRHGKRLLGASSYPLTEAVMVHGFDVPQEERDGFDRLVRRTLPILDECGLRLNVVRTNFRKLRLAKWDHSHGAALAAVLQQFSHDHAFGLIGSSEPYSHPVYPWGSTPGTDPLLSCDAMQIVHEGAGNSRTQKAALVGQHPTAAARIRVCWAVDKDYGGNCGTCEKCVRSRLNFIAAGLAEPACFDAPFELAMVDTLTPSTMPGVAELAAIADYAKARGVRAEWLDRLNARLQAQQYKPVPRKQMRRRSLPRRVADSVRKRWRLLNAAMRGA